MNKINLSHSPPSQLVLSKFLMGFIYSNIFIFVWYAFCDVRVGPGSIISLGVIKVCFYFIIFFMNLTLWRLLYNLQPAVNVLILWGGFRCFSTLPASSGGFPITAANSKAHQCVDRAFRYALIPWYVNYCLLACKRLCLGWQTHFGDSVEPHHIFSLIL